MDKSCVRTKSADAVVRVVIEEQKILENPILHARGACRAALMGTVWERGFVVGAPMWCDVLYVGGKL